MEKGPAWRAGPFAGRAATSSRAGRKPRRCRLPYRRLEEGICWKCGKRAR
jgi:hypothetical protein